MNISILGETSYKPQANLSFTDYLMTDIKNKNTCKLLVILNKENNLQNLE